MTKLIHTADVHLDSPLKSLALKDPDLRERVIAATRTALTRIVDAALSEAVDAVLIAGDLFDGQERSARTAAFLLAQLDRLRVAGIRVFLIKGNHDAENPITGDLDLPENVHVFTGHGGRVALNEAVQVHGVSFSGRQAPDSLLPKFAAPVEGAVNVAMLHTSLAGSQGHDVYAPCTVAELAALGFDYWALGHIHRRQVHSETPWIVMPGCPQGRDIGEAGPRSATLIEIDDDARFITRVGEIPTAAVEFAVVEIDAAGLEEAEALRDVLRRELWAMAEVPGCDAALLRVTLRGATPLRWAILRDRDTWEETVAQLARDTGRLWLEKLSLDLSEPAGTSTKSAVDDLARLMAEIRAEPGFHSALRADAEQLLSDLPPARRAALLPDEAAADRLTAGLAEDGALRIIARMKGTA
ncbi:metallophosphoesterase family protein [Sagittula salina]|uniref:DNA repair exonuclease n=1 Tax=Sagittula salina TaxID=2820268 RepID=A0A940MMI4_9RHOB|nr:DNA repair exonuclease [Sagittula salina]MBP0481208.1 DNA repair exonuclease [Sagittula salina]